MTNDDANHRRRRGAWLGGLLGLLLALAGVGYALAPSPSAPTGRDKVPNASSSQVLAPASSGSGNGNDNCIEPSGGNGNCVKTFGVTVGRTPVLYPSLVRQLPVTYTNPNSFDISVTTYRVSVSVPAAQSVSCPAASLQVPVGTITLSPALTAPKKGSVSTTIPINLPADAPEGCQGASFSITVNASAVKK